jgi:hypothetical protein
VQLKPTSETACLTTSLVLDGSFQTLRIRLKDGGQLRVG